MHVSSTTKFSLQFALWVVLNDEEWSHTHGPRLRCHHTASGMCIHVSEQEFGFTPLASHRTPCSHNEILLQISPLSQEKLAVIPRKLNLHPVLWGKISFVCEGMGQNLQPKHRECFWVEEKAVHPGMQHVARGSRSNKKGENKGQAPISIPRKCYLAGTHTCHSLTKC